MASETLKKALLTFSQEEFIYINERCANQNWTPSEQFIHKTERIIKGNHHSINASRILLIAAVVLLLSVTTVFTFADLRENIINSFKEFYQTHFNMEYGNNQPGDIAGNGIEKVYTLVLPDGFKIIQHNKNEHSVITVWENTDVETIILSQGDGITKRSIDNERLIQSKTVIDGIECEVYSESGYILVLWNTAEYTFSIDYYGERTINEIADLIHLAEVTQ